MLRAIVLMLGLAASVFATASAQGVGTPRVGAAAPAGPTLYVSTTGKDNDATYNGLTPQKAFLTVTKAVAAAASGATISIAAGRYVEKQPLLLTKSLTLSGPPVPAPSDTSTELPPLPPIDTLCQKQACITTDSATDSGDRVINISAGTSGQPTVTLANLVLLGPDMSKHPTKSSYAIVVDAVPLTVQNATVVAGVGGPGKPGTDGPAPGPGFGTTSPPGRCESVPDGCNCIAGTPGKSRYDAAGKEIAQGGPAGKVVYNYCPHPFGVVAAYGPPYGEWGGDGDPGPRGSGGVKANRLDAHFTRGGDRLTFQGSTAGSGGPGNWGADGGGGGPGGSRTTFMPACGVDADKNLGGSGGWGGSGGAPGNGGSGGGQGGGAFGLVVFNATVGGTALSIYGGRGGPGGAGGQGGTGGSGTKGDDGKSGSRERDCAGGFAGGKGGKGGDGGTGGAGGGGAGGDGGPSIDVVLIGSGNLAGSLRLATRGGSGGGGGGGGAAGPNGPLADGGVNGQQESRAQYQLK